MRLGKTPAAPDRLRETAPHASRIRRHAISRDAGGRRAAQRASRSRPRLRSAWQARRGDGAAAERALAALGFAVRAESANHLRLLARGRRSRPASAAPPRVDRSPGTADCSTKFAALADPDLALLNLASCIAAMGARTSFLALLEEHPATRKVLLKLFASSSHLSALFIRHPEMLDTLVRSDLVRQRRPPDELRDELAGLLAASEDFESRLDAHPRSFRQQEFLRIAIADLAGNLELEEVQTELTGLAETCCARRWPSRVEEVAARYPSAGRPAAVRARDGPAGRRRDVV